MRLRPVCRRITVKVAKSLKTNALPHSLFPFFQTMGIIFVFILFLIVLLTVGGGTIFYHLSYLIAIKWLHFSLSSKWLWVFICLIISCVNLYCLLFFLNDSKGGTPDISVVWKFLMGVSVIISVLTCFVGLRLIKT